MRALIPAILGTVAITLGGCDQASQTPTTAGEPAPAAAAPTLTDNTAQVSYVIGYDAAQQMLQQGVAIDTDAYIAGMQDSIAGRDPQLDQATAEAAMTSLQERLQTQARERQAAAGSENKRISSEFLENNANAEGVVVTDSGLQYKVLTEGSGPMPGPDSTVRVHYEGRLVNGRVFDSSIERGEPASFGVAQVIPGWTEALQLMPEGSKWTLYIPPELAYGEDAPPVIGPNQALVFDVELLDANVE